jgi:hypothetical protein
MTVEVVAPDRGGVDLEQALQDLRRAPTHQPFSQGIVDFCSEFSSVLLRETEALRFPELRVLGFHTRRAAVTELQHHFEALASRDCVLVPRGLVFHIPPANVDTIFLYSWLLAALTGNRNVIRISSRQSPQTSLLLRIFGEVTRSGVGDEVRSTTLILRYGHEREVTAAISAVADVRVIWGGDGTVNDIRSIPVPPHTRDVTFPDRYSMALIKASEYLALDSLQRAEIAGHFFNDTYWFDQAGCSSPRLLVWLGGAEACAQGAQLFIAELDAQIKARRYQLPTGAYLDKLTFACGAVMDGGVIGYEARGNELCVLSLRSLQVLRRDHCGAGLLFQCATERLDDLAEIIERRDQTLTHFGFTTEELFQFAHALNGRGIDRMVPIGKALEFHRYWDGFDLLQEMTRRVHICGR